MPPTARLPRTSSRGTNRACADCSESKPMNWKTSFLAVLVTSQLLSCFGGATKIRYSAFELRASVAHSTYNKLGAQDQKLLRAGQIRVGLPEEAMYIARGEPALHWRTQLSGRQCNVLLYNYARTEAVGDLALYSCNGVIVHAAEIKPALPYWRLTQVAPRLIEETKHFDAQTLERQWELVAGILQRGQRAKDVYIAFGKPYNTGMEEREDGVRSDSQIFLDHGGEAYGLTITLIGNAVAGWKIPAKRQLTPEAQKKRLELTEQRLMAKLKELDDNSERRHRETVGLLNDVLTNQDEMKDSLANIDASVATAIASEEFAMRTMIPDGAIQASGLDVNGSDGASGPANSTESCPSGSRTFTLNSCTYSEIPGQCSMGNTCNNEDLLCGSDYACLYLSSSAASGICVPEASQYQTCDEPRFRIGPSCRRTRDCKGNWKDATCKRDDPSDKKGHCVLRID
tara:strand:+ start:4293 stop:5663 length:1371 start_codon:yes stop_codon:yes gene_type:complete